MTLKLAGYLTLITLGLGIAASAQPSPFQRAAQAAPGATATAETEESGLQFSGVVALGADKMVCITDVAAKRSHWIKVGQTVAGIRVVSYSSESNLVTVSRAGRENTLELKKPTFDPANLVAFQPTSASPAPMAGLAEQVALTPKEKATEARMLVSDLLEIGMIQRKAYEEAKKAEVAAKREERKKAGE